jgi:hypothetical protein
MRVTLENPNYIVILIKLFRNYRFNLKFSERIYILTIATNREKCLKVWLLTDSFLCLVKKATSDCYNNIISAKTKPVTNLKFINNCENI